MPALSTRTDVLKDEYLKPAPSMEYEVQIYLKRFLKATRGTKKKREPLIVDGKNRHVSTARLLDTYQMNKNRGD